jgi:Na+/H+ antiporter NhaA
MTRQHASARNLASRLWPSPERLAAAAAVQDPSLLMQLQATQEHGERPRRRRSAIPAAMRGETGGALLLVAATILALAWSNSPWQASYASFWHAPVALAVGPWMLGADLRTWINEGLMTLFFLVVGLEAKRERDLGELREGRRLTARVLAGLAGMSVSAVVCLALTAGGAGASGWGVAISSDTALALGALAIAGGRRAHRLRVFMLTLLVVDDVVALLIISFIYPSRIHVAAVIVALALLALLLSMRAIAGRQFRVRGDSTAVLTPLSVLTGVALWLALFESGIGPVISGLLIGLLTNAYEPKSEGPAAISPNDRIQHRLHSWTSKVVVPIFALANAGLHLDGHVLASAATSAVTWGIVQVGILATALVASALAAAALAPLRRRVGDSGARRRSRVAATMPCAA